MKKKKKTAFVLVRPCFLTRRWGSFSTHLLGWGVILPPSWSCHFKPPSWIDLGGISGQTRWNRPFREWRGTRREPLTSQFRELRNGDDPSCWRSVCACATRVTERELLSKTHSKQTIKTEKKSKIKRKVVGSRRLGRHPRSAGARSLKLLGRGTLFLF